MKKNFLRLITRWLLICLLWFALVCFGLLWFALVRFGYLGLYDGFYFVFKPSTYPATRKKPPILSSSTGGFIVIVQ